MESGITRRPTFMRLLLLFGLLAIVLLSGKMVSASEEAGLNNPFYYLSPRPGAAYVFPGTSILFRSEQIAVTKLLQNNQILVEGSESGKHSGEVELASDGRTVIFHPNTPFTPGESVKVTIRLSEMKPLSGISGDFIYAFSVSEPGIQEPDIINEIQQSLAQNQSRTGTDKKIPPFEYLTAPPDLPPIAVERQPGLLGEGYLFVSIFNYDSLFAAPGYALILDNNGEPVYYDRPHGVPVAVDFKKQPNGLLTYSAPGPDTNGFFGLNNKYEIVDEYEAEGYLTDFHDLQLLDNGNALLLIHDLQTVDMSELAPGGSTEAPVIGCVIQEVGQDNKKLFQWRSWDYIDILETNRPLDDDPLRYIHCNSIELDHDGHILISSRHLDEVTKINRHTGDIIWRLGGRHNEFDFTNDYGFNYQHDARRLANGNLTIYDNGVLHEPKHSRGIEYWVSESTRTVAKVAEFRNTPETYALAMGNMQTLPNSNVVVGWGRSSAPILTEFDKDGNKLLELTTAKRMGTYRAFRFPWQGTPTWPPVLVTRLEDSTAHLHFSWNGSTETAIYKIFAGRRKKRLDHIATVSRDGFETTYSYEMPRKGFWYFQVIPIDGEGIEGPPSNIAHAVLGGESVYLAVVGSQ